MTIIRLDYKFRITPIERRPLSFGEQVTQKFSNTPIKPRAILDLIREILPMMVKVPRRDDSEQTKLPDQRSKIHPDFKIMEGRIEMNVFKER